MLLVSDPSPHRQQVGLSDYPVKRESDYTEIVWSIFVKSRYVTHSVRIDYKLRLRIILQDEYKDRKNTDQ